MLDGYRPPKPSGEPPSFRDFDAHRYDMAKLHAQMDILIAVTSQSDASGIQSVVPVPAVEKLHRAKGLSRLRSTVARATGRAW